MNLPNKKYNVIVIDPPWQIEKIKKRVRPNQVDIAYPMMSLKEIMGIPIKEITDDKCILFLWIIDKYLFNGKRILESWGFKYHLTMTWDKTNGLAMYGFNRQSEFILVGLKGKHNAYPPRKTIPTSFRAKSKKHSEKPIEFYKMIRHLEGSKIDIFARRRHEGFDAFGNQVDKDMQVTLLNPQLKILRPSYATMLLL